MINNTIKKFISLISAFLIIVSLFTVSEKEIYADNTYQQTYTEVLTGKDFGYHYKTQLINHDARTFKSIQFTINEKNTGEQIYSVSYDDINSSYTIIESWGINEFTFSRPDNLEDEKEYEIAVTVVSNYKNEFINVTGECLANVCLGRLRITKTWDDDNNAKGKRPDINTFAGYINLNDVKPNEIYVDDTITPEDNVYYYLAYGDFNIKNGVTITEDIFDYYICDESASSLPFYDLNNLLNKGGYIFDEENVSKASLKNKKTDLFFDIQLLKVDENDNPLKDVVFLLQNIGDETVIINNWMEIKPNGEWVFYSDKDGIVNIKNLPASGKYRIKEHHPTYGYKMSNPKFSVDFTYEDAEKVEGQYNRLLDLGKVVNTKINYCGVKIIKKDDNYNRDVFLEGAEFKLYNNSGNDIVLKDGNVIVDKQEICTLITDENGIAETEIMLPRMINESDFAQYLLIETKAPVDHYLGDNSRRFNFMETTEELVEFTYHNKRKTSMLVIEKVPLNLYDFSKGDTFTFDIEINDNNDQPYNGSFYYDIVDPSEVERRSGYTRIAYFGEVPYTDDIRDDLDKITFVDGKASLDIPLGQYVFIFDIPTGFKYSVREQNSDDYLYVDMVKMFEKPIYEEQLDDRTFPIGGRIEFKFINQKPNPSLEFEATKLLEGRDLKDKEFTFELKDDEGNVVATTTNDADGKIIFKDININPKKLNVKKILLSEATEEEKNNYNFYSERNFIFTKHVPKNAYSSVYTDEVVLYGEATEEQLEVHRYRIDPWVMEHEGITHPNYYYFELNSQLEKVLGFDGIYKNASAYTIDEELEFTISEVTDEAKSITYDHHEEKVKVRVYGELDKELSVEYTYDSEKPTFINTQNPIDIEISKINLGGEELAGAKIKVTGEDFLEEWTSRNKPHVVKLLPGTYTFHEEVAPEGYETVTDITFTVDKDGNVTVEEIEGIVKAIDNKLIVIDKEVPEEYFKIEVSKTDLGGKELPGAKIKVTGDDFEEQWTSSDKPRVLYLLPGTYTFHEEVAPEGYETVTDITFEVDDKGNVIVKEIEGIVKSIGNKLIVIDKNKKKKPIKPDIPYTVPKTGVE